MRAMSIVTVFLVCFASTLSALGISEEKARDVSPTMESPAAAPIIVPGIGFELNVSMKPQSAKADWEANGLKGRVESYSLEVATPVQRSDGKWTDQKSTWGYSQGYDSKGNLLEQVYSSFNLTRQDKTLFTYDEKGQLAEMMSYSSDGTPLVKTQYTYDSMASLSQIVSLSPDGSLIWKTAYKYDVKLNQIEMTAFKPDGSIPYKTLISFDENGRRTSVVQSRLDKLPYAKTTYSYDDNRTRIEDTRYDLNNVPFEQYVRILDSSGNLAEVSFYQNGILSSRTVCTYNYDKRGNWVLRIDQKSVASKGTIIYEPPTVNYRAIEYWD